MVDLVRREADVERAVRTESGMRVRTAGITAAGTRPRRVTADGATARSVDVAFGALHHRLLITGAPIDGAFVTALAAV